MAQSKDLKRKLFEEQKKLNQVDYQHSQTEIKKKQQYEEEIKTIKQALEQKLVQLQLEYDTRRQKQVEVTLEKEALDQQLA